MILQKGAGRLPALRRLLAAGALLGLAACQAAPVTEPGSEELAGPPVAYPADTKRRILAIAMREWQDFGAPEIDFTGFTARPLLAGLPETDPRVFPNLLAYWNSVRSGWQDYIRDQKLLYEAGNGAWTREAWSAAFVSYVMRSAGVDRDDFPWDAGHRTYIDALIQRHRLYGPAAVFQVYDVTQYAPRPGDLICADRSRPLDRRLTSVAERLAEIGRPRGMHCDIVVELQPGRVAAIGGNVGNSVSRSWFPTDADGYLLRREPPLDPSERSFFAVIRTSIPDPPLIARGPAG